MTDARFLAALVLLAVNDHVLKGAGPGWLTGKLSDATGVFVATVILGVVLRPRLGAVAATAGFAAIKVSFIAAELAAPVLGGVTRRDPGDLVALLAVLPAYRLLRQHRAELDAEPGFLRTALFAGSLVAVTLTVSATSCVSRPFINGLAVTSGVVYAHIERPETSDEAVWAASHDGGHSWTASQPPSQPATAQDEACATGRCWRVIPGRRVEEQDVRGGLFRSEFSFSGEHRNAMELRAGCGLYNHTDYSAVTVVNRADSVEVIVAMGPQGVLRRASDGEWERRAVLDLRPLRSDGSTAIYRITSLTPLGLLLAAPAFWYAGRRRPGRRSGIAATVSAVGALVIIMAAGILALGTVEFTVTGPAVAVVTLAVFLAAILIARRPARPKAPNDPWPGPARPGPTQ